MKLEVSGYVRSFWRGSWSNLDVLAGTLSLISTYTMEAVWACRSSYLYWELKNTWPNSCFENLVIWHSLGSFNLPLFFGHGRISMSISRPFRAGYQLNLSPWYIHRVTLMTRKWIPLLPSIRFIYKQIETLACGSNQGHRVFWMKPPLISYLKIPLLL